VKDSNAVGLNRNLQKHYVTGVAYVWVYKYPIIGKEWEVLVHRYLGLKQKKKGSQYVFVP
jgi:hypothetical protein